MKVSTLSALALTLMKIGCGITSKRTTFLGGRFSVAKDGRVRFAQQYGIRAIPAPWLIDKDGTLITHQARGEKLERLVAEAVKN